MRDDLVGDTARVTAYAGRVERHGPMEPRWLGRRRRVWRLYSRTRSAAGIGVLAPRPGKGGLSATRLRFLGIELPPRDIRLDKQVGCIGIRQRNDLSATQPAISLHLVIEAVGEPERVVLPGEQGDTVVHRLQENRGVGDTRQVEVLRKVLDDLLDRHVVAAPQRDAIELHPQSRGGKSGHEKLVALQLPARPRRQRALARQPHGQPLDRRIGTRLSRNQEPLVRLREPGGHRARGGFLLNFGLLDLVRREVERFTLFEYGQPRQVPPDGLVEVLQPRLVHGQEHERVAVDPGNAAP